MTALSKKYRLSSHEVKRVFVAGKRQKGKGLHILFIKNHGKLSRCAVVVSSKTAKKSVIRNKLRRQTKDVLHSFVSSIQTGYDIVIVLQRVFVSKKEIEESLADALRACGCLN